MKAVFLVPRRDDGGHRDRLWAWATARWRAYFPDIEIVEGHHDTGPFNRSAAINAAAKAAGDWDLGIVIDSDIFVKVGQLRKAIATARRTGRVTWAHRRWRGLSEDWTKRTLEQRLDFGPELEAVDIDVLVERTNPMSWSCCIVVPRAVWDEIGGFDERFVGWGFEDMAFRSVVCGLHGWERIEADVYHLWHPRSEERIVKGQPAATASREYVANARLGRRYMVAVIRDHGIGDQPGEETMAPELRAVHVSNLQRDDAKLAPVARRLGLPDWTNWWPPLEELRDGARESVGLALAPTITAVVRTGGAAETWNERREYLRRSLASFARHVGGPIVQRVLYADWDDAFRPELEAIASEHGFYVAGEGHHGYVAGGQRLWRYLARRARGRFIFQAEDDFLYRSDVDLADLAEVLEAKAHLAQIALLREPAYESERQKGGILGWPTETFTPVRMNGYGWLEHRNFWTQNPSLFRREIVERPWPQRASSERIFGDQLLRESHELRFAFWGDGTPTLEHIGLVRAGDAY